MPDVKPPAEPSMEEILASIRRIISDDVDPGARSPAASAASSAVPIAPPGRVVAVERGDDEVLELTNRLNDDGSIETVRQESPMPPPNQRDPDHHEAFVGRDAAAAEGAAPAREDSHDAAFADHGPEGDPLMSHHAASAAANAFDDLARSSEDYEPAHLRTGVSGAMTVEELVQETLRPLLRDWLDDNLPSMVEGLVHAEIQRLSRRR